MNRKAGSWMVQCAVSLAALGAPLLAIAASCRADSGPVRATLVELYTSEGCSSCPPADRELGRLTHAGAAVIPLALHVDYWDSIGWKDRLAQPAFADRQRWEVQANHERTSYTPHFFVNGRPVLDWRADLGPALRPAATTADATLAVVASPEAPGRWRIRVDGRAAAGARPRGPLQLFVAVTEGGLSSQVDAGENRGVRLEHEAVTRQFFGPIALSGGGVSLDRVVDVPGAAAGHAGIVAFIQDGATAEVVQAVSTGPCRPT